jgi:hypothetical protein
VLLKHGRPNAPARIRRNPLRPDCSCACTTGMSAQPPAGPQLPCAVPALLPHQRPPAGSRVACCFARARAHGNEPSQPSVLHRASDPHRAASAPTALCHCVASPSELAAPYPLPLPPRGPWSARTRSPPWPVPATSKFSTSSLQCRLTSCAAFPSTASNVLHARLHCSPVRVHAESPRRGTASPELRS